MGPSHFLVLAPKLVIKFLKRLVFVLKEYSTYMYVRCVICTTQLRNVAIIAHYLRPFTSGLHDVNRERHIAQALHDRYMAVD